MLSRMSIDQKEYWDEAAANKDFTTPFQMDLFRDHIDRSSRILDVGCGYGRILDLLWQEGYKNTCGIDFSRGMIDRGKVDFPCLDLSVSGPSFEFEDNSFDAVLLIAVLTCIADEKEQKELIGEIRRILKPGGHLYLNDFLINSDERNQARYGKFQEKYGSYGVFELDEGAVLRHHSSEYISELTSEFKTIIFKKTVYVTMNKNRSNGFYYLGKRLP